MSLKNVLHEAVIPFGTGWEVYTRPPAAYEKYGGCLEAELLGDGLQCLFFFFHGTPFFLERRTDRQTVVTQSWVFGRHFLQNELNEPVTSAKQLVVSVTSDKIQAFK